MTTPKLPAIREVTERVSQWSCGRYFFYWAGDELLLQATNDQDAIKEAVRLQFELESG